MKSGIKTTEFWLSTGALLLGALLAGGVLGGEGSTGAQIAGAVLAGLAALGYTGARAKTKDTAAVVALDQKRLEAHVELSEKTNGVVAESDS